MELNIRKTSSLITLPMWGGGCVGLGVRVSVVLKGINAYIDVSF